MTGVPQDPAASATTPGFAPKIADASRLDRVGYTCECSMALADKPKDHRGVYWRRIPDLARAADSGHENTRRCLRRLEDAGLVRHYYYWGRCHYAITRKGRGHLKRHAAT